MKEKRAETDENEAPDKSDEAPLEEHDTHGDYQERDENLYEVPGDMKLNDFNNLTNFGIEETERQYFAKFQYLFQN